jgi:excinuclease ABC subunit C
MVTFIIGEPNKSLYRHFKIRQKKRMSDTDSLREVLVRRIKYFDKWGKPNLIIVDGGKPQVSTFLKALGNYNIPVVGLAKRNEKLILPIRMKGKNTFTQIKVPRGPALYLLQRIRDEAHRFARRYHHKLVKNKLLKT